MSIHGVAAVVMAAAAAGMAAIAGLQRSPAVFVEVVVRRYLFCSHEYKL